MSKSSEEKSQLQKRFKLVARSWSTIEKYLDEFRQDISDDYFEKHPVDLTMLKPKHVSQEHIEEASRKKLFKHSLAVINYMEMIVAFVNGDEEGKPIFYLLGKQHKRVLVHEKMFLEMKDSICRVIQKRINQESSTSWDLVLSYIYVNYVFQGMEMIQDS